MLLQSPRRDIATGLIILAVWAAWTIRAYIGHWAPDLSAIYMAARFYGLGDFDLVYASPARFFGTDYPQSWVQATAALGYPGQQTFPYIYPPLWAAVFAPIATRTDPMTFFAGAYFVQIAALAAAPLLAWRLMRPALPFSLFAGLSVVLLSTSVIAAHAAFHSQPQITVTVLILLAFERLASNRPVTAGAVLGLAAALKVAPVLLVAIFLIERQYRAAIACIAVAGALALASLIIAGPDLHGVFLEKIRLLGQQLVIWDLNISLRAALYQLNELAAGRPFPASSVAQPLLVAAPVWVGLVATGILGAAAALIWRASRATPQPPRLGLRLAAGFLILTLCAPLSWAHHYLLVLLLVPALYGPLKPAPALVIIAAFGILYSNALAPHLATAFGATNFATLIMVAGMFTLFGLFSLSARAARQ